MSKIELVTKETTLQYPQIFNESEDIEFRDGKNIDIVEVEEKSVTLIVPHFVCSKGHSLILYLFANEEDAKRFDQLPVDDKKLNCLIVSGEVGSLDQIDESKVSIVLELKRGNSKNWQKFLSQRSERQEKISEIFKKYKV